MDRENILTVIAVLAVALGLWLLVYALIIPQVILFIAGAFGYGLAYNQAFAISVLIYFIRALTSD